MVERTVSIKRRRGDGAGRKYSMCRSHVLLAAGVLLMSAF